MKNIRKLTIVRTGWKSISILTCFFILFAADTPLFFLEGTDKEPCEKKQESVVIGPVEPHVINKDLRELPEPKKWKPGNPIYERPRLVYPREESHELKWPDKTDKVRDSK